MNWSKMARILSEESGDILRNIVLYCSGIDRILEAYLIMGCILLWNWYKIRGLLNAGMYIAMILIKDQMLVEWCCV